MDAEPSDLTLIAFHPSLLSPLLRKGFFTNDHGVHGGTQIRRVPIPPFPCNTFSYFPPPTQANGPVDRAWAADPFTALSFWPTDLIFIDRSRSPPKIQPSPASTEVVR